MADTRQRLATLVKQTVIITLITCVLFVLVEGLSSIGLMMLRIRDARPAAATWGTASLYDEEIGWVGKPDSELPHLYGKEVGVRTNGQGFRDDSETESQVAGAKQRLICSGDSFTFGQGVANEDTWCQLLETFDSRLDTVNLGQPGYGVDQMYLLYMRDGLALEHSIHILAFIGADLDRMGRLQQHLYGKPALSLVDGNLQPENMPVPGFSWWLSRKVALLDPNFFELSRRITGSLFSPSGDGRTLVERVGPVARAVFDSVQSIDQENGIVTLFVYLPGEGDIASDTAWRTWTAETMAELKANYIDMTDDLRKLPAPWQYPTSSPDEGLGLVTTARPAIAG